MKLKKLSAGDSIALMCPGSPCPPKTNVELTQNCLSQRYHFDVIYREDTYRKLSAKERADIFLDYIFNPKIKCIWTLRGGEGTLDIMPYVLAKKAELAKTSPKIILGLSDVTPVLIYFAQTFYWPTIHGFNALKFAKGEAKRDSVQLTETLLWGDGEPTLPTLTPLNSIAKHTTTLQAPIVGGNLSLIHCMLKEPWEMNAQDKIIFLEDVHERAHVILRTLKHLQRVKVFDKAIAIILGDFMAVPVGDTLEKQEKEKVYLQHALQQFAADLSIPVFETHRIGHGAINDPIVLNYLYTLSSGFE